MNKEKLLKHYNKRLHYLNQKSGLSIGERALLEESVKKTKALLDSIENTDKIKLEDYIPQDTLSCYDLFTGTCPFFEVRYKEDEEFGSCCYEYCKYLHKELSIQDQVKDCGIGEDE